MTYAPGSVCVAFLDGGQWSACFGLSYRDLCLYDQAKSRRVIRPGGMELRAVTGTGGIAVNRNKVAAQFLADTDAEWLFMVDTDMGFAPNTIDRLIDSADPRERPVVGALAFACVRESLKGDYYAERFRIQPTLYQWVDTDTEVGVLPILDYPRDAIVQVAATGAACMLIHRAALETVHAKYGRAWFDPITHPTGLNGGPRTFSEDLSFCVRLQACGIPLYVDTAVKTTHEKGCLYLDEDTFDQQMALWRLATDLAKGGDDGDRSMGKPD